jgi:DNA-binding LacI/PurR family transcriptional regulator
MDNRPTAIISGNDSIAFHFIAENASHGLRCPRDFSMVGFDAEPAGRISSPTLASYEQPLVHMGKTAVGILVEQINGEDRAKKTIEFPMRFVDGGSLGPVPA